MYIYIYMYLRVHIYQLNLVNTRVHIYVLTATMYLATHCNFLNLVANKLKHSIPFVELCRKLNIRK